MYRGQDLDTAYVEPRNEIERRLVGFWQELLGVGRVGVEDSFFDLGGHSLIAVRLFAMVKKAFRAEFPISILFEAPTVAACARLIAAEVGETEEAPAGADESAARSPQRRFTHLVPRPRGGGGGKLPLFLVGGGWRDRLTLVPLWRPRGAGAPLHAAPERGLFAGGAPPAAVG